jgi:type II secretory pathway pseudopilin PulG
MSHRTPRHHRIRPLLGLTLLELLVVALIISILTTVATVTVTTMTTRARIAATFGTIRSMEIAADVYEIDLGEYPPSSTGTLFAPAVLNPQLPAAGNGYYTLAVLHSMSGTANNPSSLLWHGPYLDIVSETLADLGDFEFWAPVGRVPNFLTSTAATQQIIDAWGNPLLYVRHGVGDGDTSEYESGEATQFPPGSPFATTETFFNFNRYQIISLGPNRTTLETPFIGLDPDDITNLGSGF